MNEHDTQHQGRFLTESNLCLIPDPCRDIDGVQHVSLNGQLIPLRQGADPVRTFAAGWRPTALFTGFAPIFLLAFVHEDGGEGMWFLDHRMTSIGNDAAHLPQDALRIVRARAAPLLRELADSVLSPQDRPLSGAARGLLALNGAIRRAIADLARDEVLPAPSLILAEQLGSSGLPCLLQPGDRLVSLRREFLCEGFALDWQQRLDRAISGGVLTWPGPVDGAPLRCAGSLVFDDFHFAYLFMDESRHLPFLAIVGDHLSCVGGVWFPTLGIMVAEEKPAAPLMRRAALLHARDWFVHHLVTWHDELVSYLRRPQQGVVNILRSRSFHIGHQLWNELSGIDRLVRNGAAREVTHLVSRPPRGLEIYGPIDTLFPEILGTVDRSIDSDNALIRRVYRTGAIACRVTGDFVPAGLRDRLVAHALRERASQSRPDRAARRLLIGLRVENRTLIGLDEFCCALVDLVARRYPDTIVVFDGHNSQDGSNGAVPIGSQGEMLARTSPHAVERGIVDRVRQRFPERADRILDTIMQPVSASIEAAIDSTCFVSIWGASLAKYRWLANKPGFVLTSRWNLENRDDLDIYHAPRFMEDPAPLAFIDRSLVEDDPQAPQLAAAGGANPGFANFRLDADGLPAIQAFLDGYLLP
ncbi:hypothetical protein NFI95_15095 [Acetobacteraceae bacterium KSS8]|uniref:Uncharacterized protein n=1 Tax=Endosaccharibacter trunci TaxID=2812733 RepID=A0ABT1WA68_9PROT|nr:hypothetical protein [Acetobacteraceae bacterium KSS8]